MTTIYLAGPINGCTDEEMHDWRDDLAYQLLERNSNLVILTPTARDYRGKEAENVRIIVEGDKDDINASDVVIAYCPRPSVGTSMEVFYAWNQDKYICALVPYEAPVSPWLRYHSHIILSDAESVAYHVGRLACI